MTSIYGIITVSDLESDGMDYSNIKTAYTDSVLEEWLSQAEIYICSELKTTFNSTAANEIKFAVKEIARRLALNALILNKTPSMEGQNIVDAYTMPIIQTIINNYTPTLINGYSNTSVVRIRMDGYNKNE